MTANDNMIVRVVSDPLTMLRLERGVEHLFRLGPRAVAEFLIAISAECGGLPAILDLIDEYRCRLTPEMVRAAGGDRFPPRPLQVVPR
jgi:hypothetical protein